MIVLVIGTVASAVLQTVGARWRTRPLRAAGLLIGLGTVVLTVVRGVSLGTVQVIAFTACVLAISPILRAWSRPG